MSHHLQHSACDIKLSTSWLVQELVGPLQTALSLGLQYPPLATAAIAAMEQWETEQPQALRAVAPQVVPLLDPYLLEIIGLVPGSDAVAVTGEGKMCL